MFVLIFILLFASLSPAQESNIEKYQFISPLPGSKLIMPENNIIIRQGDIVDPTTIKEESIEVVGSISGLHSGKLILSNDLRTLIFVPDEPYERGEEVTARFNGGTSSFGSKRLLPIEFKFEITNRSSGSSYKRSLEEILEINRD